MQSDLPHTLYNSRGGDKAGTGDNNTVRADDPAFALQQEAYERAVARKKAKEEGREPYTMNELFRK